MKKWQGLLLLILIIALDQLSKGLANTQLIAYQPVPVLPFLNWTLAYNTGAAFSFLHQSGQWHLLFFIAFSSIVSLILLILFIKLPSQQRLKSWALILILSGALGNLIDRFTLGFVVDFIDLHLGSYHWPVFNVADIAISVGAVLLLLELAKKES